MRSVILDATILDDRAIPWLQVSAKFNGSLMHPFLVTISFGRSRLTVLLSRNCRLVVECLSSGVFREQFVQLAARIVDYTVTASRPAFLSLGGNTE